MKIPTRRRKI